MTAVAEQHDDEVTGVGLRSPRSARQRATEAWRKESVCQICGRPKPRGVARCETCIGVRHLPDALIDPCTRYVDDVACQLFVAYFDRGATCASIGLALGVTRSRAQQLEIAALRRFLARCQLAGISAADVREILAARPSSDTPFVPSEQDRNYRTRGARVEPPDLDAPSEAIAAAFAALDAVADRMELLAEIGDFARGGAR